MAKPTKQTKAKHIGNAGELFVAELLSANGWQIVATQWSCRWGELDVIACDRHWLIFVEVKTRNARSWDENGLLAITPQKQSKLQMAAAEFLSQHPHLTDLSCRFDVALVRLEMSASNLPTLQLHDYLESAFADS